MTNLEGTMEQTRNPKLTIALCGSLLVVFIGWFLYWHVTRLVYAPVPFIIGAATCTVYALVKGLETQFRVFTVLNWFVFLVFILMAALSR